MENESDKVTPNQSQLVRFNFAGLKIEFIGKFAISVFGALFFIFLLASFFKPDFLKVFH